jgi:MFS family permease
LQKRLAILGYAVTGDCYYSDIFSSSIVHYIAISVILGIGTAIVYPTFLASIAEDTNPQLRAKSLGVFRFWRDLGYVIGALLTGIFTDFFSIEFSIDFIGLLTIIFSVIIVYRMCCKPQARRVFKKSQALYKIKTAML